LLLVKQFGRGFFEPVKGVGGERVGGLVRVYEQGFLAICDFDVGFRDAGLEVEDGVGVELEGFEDAVYFGILWQSACSYLGCHGAVLCQIL
jgi:hypothetical protein